MTSESIGVLRLQTIRHINDGFSYFLDFLSTTKDKQASSQRRDDNFLFLEHKIFITDAIPDYLVNRMELCDRRKFVGIRIWNFINVRGCKGTIKYVSDL